MGPKRMKTRFWMLMIWVLSVFAMLPGTGRETKADTVNLAYRCEGDGSVTFFAATDHTELETNAGQIMLARHGGGTNGYLFNGWVEDLPSDVHGEWGWLAGFDDANAIWQTVTVAHFESGIYNLFTMNTEEGSHVASQLESWIEVEIDCGLSVTEVEVDMELESDTGTGKQKAKSKSRKAKHRGNGKAKGKGKGHDRDKGKGHGKQKTHGKSKSKHKKSKDDFLGHSADSILHVTVFSSATFDATHVDQETVELGDEGLDGVAYPLGASVRDVNDDGRDDLVLFFSLSELIREGAVDERTVALRLVGFTIDGLFIVGYDEVPFAQ